MTENTAFCYIFFSQYIIAREKSGLTRTFIYGVDGRVTEESSPEQGTVLYTYDANGNIATKTDARGVTITYSWDNQNRLTAKAYSDGSPRAVFSYQAKDVALSLIHISEPTRQAEISYAVF